MAVFCAETARVTPIPGAGRPGGPGSFMAGPSRNLPTQGGTLRRHLRTAALLHGFPQRRRPRSFASPFRFESLCLFALWRFGGRARGADGRDRSRSARAVLAVACGGALVLPRHFRRRIALQSLEGREGRGRRALSFVRHRHHRSAGGAADARSRLPLAFRARPPGCWRRYGCSNSPLSFPVCRCSGAS